MNRDGTLPRLTKEMWMSPEPAAQSPDNTAVLIDSLTRVFARVCRELGKAGHPSEASRLAAEAWSLLRNDYPGEAERINGAMHYLARLEQDMERQVAQTSQP